MPSGPGRHFGKSLGSAVDGNWIGVGGLPEHETDKCSAFEVVGLGAGIGQQSYNYLPLGLGKRRTASLPAGEC